MYTLQRVLYSKKSLYIFLGHERIPFVFQKKPLYWRSRWITPRRCICSFMRMWRISPGILSPEVADKDGDSNGDKERPRRGLGRWGKTDVGTIPPGHIDVVTWVVTWRCYRRVYVETKLWFVDCYSRACNTKWHRTIKLQVHVLSNVYNTCV